MTRCPPARACALSDAQILDRLRGALMRPGQDDLTVVVAVDHRARYASGRCRLPSPVYDLFTVGRSVAWLLGRGVSRKTVNRAARAGWVRLGTRNELKQQRNRT